jgi:hypothetical protein
MTLPVRLSLQGPRPGEPTFCSFLQELCAHDFPVNRLTLAVGMVIATLVGQAAAALRRPRKTPRST